jgi:Sulfotransferase family
MNLVEGPDFICAGTPKAGSGWLYDQLEAHPDFWMPPVKEIVYLGHRDPELQFARPLARETGEMREDRPRRKPRKKPQQVRERLLRRMRDERDAEFVEYARSCIGQPMDLELYAGLFRFKGALLSGDISPTYSGLRADTVAEIARRFPNTRIILLVREPVSRAWSRISMLHRGDKFDESLVQDATRFRDYLENSREARIRPTKIVEKWLANAPTMQFRAFLFDDIAGDPEKARREIWAYLGADPDKPSDLPANHNRKEGNKKLEMTDIAKAVLRDFFADEIRASAEVFGGRACEWAPHYGL